MIEFTYFHLKFRIGKSKILWFSFKLWGPPLYKERNLNHLFGERAKEEATIFRQKWRSFDHDTEALEFERRLTTKCCQVGCRPALQATFEVKL